MATYKKFFFDSGVIKEADPRRITSILEIGGNTGKSSFFKYLCFKYPEDIGRISYRTASQLRSSLINMEPKPIYIMDLTRVDSQLIYLI